MATVHGHSSVKQQQQEASSQPAYTGLGKRSSSSVQSVPLDWYPNAGIPCYSFGAEDEKRRCQHLHRTSLLFKELEGEVVAVVQAKRKKDASDRQESARIAMAHPLKVFGQREERVGNSNQEKEGASLSEKKGIRKMPAPLSENELLQALPELSTGAALAVRSCVDCWRDNRLADSDLISTVRAFSGSSPVLARVFSTPKEAILPYEVASLEDMRVFAMLSRIGSSGSQSCV